MRIENHEDSGCGGDYQVVVSLHFNPKELKTTNTPFGTIVELADFKSGGEPGAPALPRKQLKVAIPEPFWPGTIELSDEKWEYVSDSATFVVPAQKPRAGSRGKHEGFHCAPDCSCRVRQRPDRPPLSEELPLPEVVPPDVGAYNELVKNPPPVVNAVSIETIGANRIAIIQVDPLRLSQKGQLELCTHVNFTIKLLKEPAIADRQEALSEFKKLYGDKGFDPKRVIVRPERFITGLDEATRLRDTAIANVINPKVIGSIIRGDWPIFEFPSDYLIITDDFLWDAATITRGVPRPGIIASFERLAEAKRARGITARVVTITDVVAGTYGDARTGSRDLQEVIRRFLKLVRNRWGVNWLLLGGDTDIIPIRQVAGGAQQGYVGPPLDVSPPAKNTSYWTGSHLNMYADSLGTWYSESIDNQLVHSELGTLFPYDSTGTASRTSPGWYFTTGDDYGTLSATPTKYIRVEGPEYLLKGQLQFLYEYNTLPTDFYYASLDSFVIRRRPQGPGPLTVPYVYTPEHDWDASGNGSIYGQCKFSGEDIDGVVQQIDISVGRAPVVNSHEADDFVDKVLAYERVGKLGWRSPNANWPRKMLIVSEDWWNRIKFGRTWSTPPANYQFFHDEAQTRTLLKLETAPTKFDHELVARVTQNDIRLLPFKRDSNPAIRGWYYATSDTDATPSHRVLRILWGSFSWPIPSQWIVVHGPIEERTPTLYDFNPTEQESGMIEQETLRKQVQAELPGLNRLERLYEDEFDLPPADQVVAPLDFLTEATVTAALNTAPHIVSLSGHGNEDGCCGVYNSNAASLTNGQLGFIAYADSCLTNDYNTGWRSMSESLMRNPNGGAVAYIGNTRFSWVGYGDDFQRAFFHQLTATRNLGLLNDSRLSVIGTIPGAFTYERWQMFSLNLLGDPEMRVYRGAVTSLVIPPIILKPRFPVINVIIRPPIGPPRPDPPPIKGVFVYVRQGKQVFSGTADEKGNLRLPQGMFKKGELEVTVSHKDYPVTTETMFMDG